MKNNNIKIESFIDIAVDLIKKIEGLSLVPYYCDANNLTILYGHVILLAEKYTKITQEDAELILKHRSS